jgi:hypothetical protein
LTRRGEAVGDNGFGVCFSFLKIKRRSQPPRSYYITDLFSELSLTGGKEINPFKLRIADNTLRSDGWNLINRTIPRTLSLPLSKVTLWPLLSFWRSLS